MKVGEEVTLRVIGRQQLQIEMLQEELRRANSQLSLASQHECAPIPCTRQCCLELGATNGATNSAGLDEDERE